MHAFLVTNENPGANFISSMNKGAPVFFDIAKIEDIRALKSFLKFPPVSPTLIVLKILRTISSEAQNAMLKIVEEPAESISFLFCVKEKDLIIETLLSRLQTIKNTAQRLESKNALENLTPTSILSDVENIKDREEAINYMENVLINADIKYKESTINAIQALKHNTNVTLTLLNFIVSLS
jgi:DNA polymerase-3 subunit delta'